MAESAVAFLLEKLGNLVVREASLFGKVEVQVRLLCNELEWMRLFLETWVSFADKLPFVHELDARIREINVKIEKILANKWRYGVENPVASEVWNASNKVESWKERRVPIVEEEDAVGMKDEMRAVKKMPIEGELQREVVG